MADKRVRPSEQQPPPGTMGPYKSKDKYPYSTSADRFGAGLQDEAMDVNAGFQPKPLNPGEKYKRGGPVKGKETKSKPLAAAGSDPGLSSMIGGMSNAASSKSDKKAGAKMAFARGGSVGIAPYKEGGFRNKAMEHKR
jgi:hypothetical protein